MTPALVEWLGRIDPAARAIGVALLVAARVAPLTILAPWLALRGTPPTLRAALLLALTVAMTPLALTTAPPLPADLLSFGACALREAALGAVFAVVTAVPLHALDQAGRLIDAMRGASQSESALPSGERSSPMGALHTLLGATLFLVLGGHRMVIDALGASWIDVPAGAPVALGELAAGSARIVVSALTLAVSFTAPAAVSLVTVEIAIGLVGRAAPAIPMHFAGMPLRAAIGVAAVLLGIAVLLPQLAPIFASAVGAASALVRSAAP